MLSCICNWEQGFLFILFLFCFVFLSFFFFCFCFFVNITFLNWHVSECAAVSKHFVFGKGDTMQAKATSLIIRSKDASERRRGGSLSLNRIIPYDYQLLCSLIQHGNSPSSSSRGSLFSLFWCFGFSSFLSSPLDCFWFHIRTTSR